MLNLFKQEGVFEHGRIGHKDLLIEYAKSSILAYPCTYAGEINCLALSKAIACGVFPLTNDFAVLKERNPMWVVKNEDFVDRLIKLLKTSIGFHMDRKQYTIDNSWESVAKAWDKDIL